MKFLPRSITGAVIAVLYLLIVGYLIWGFVFGTGGPHGEAGTSFIYALMLTLPWSFMMLSGASEFYYVVVAGLVVSALINASIIYFVVGYVSQGLRVLSGHPR